MPLKISLFLNHVFYFSRCLCRSVACEQPYLNAGPVKWWQFLLLSTVLSPKGGELWVLFSRKSRGQHQEGSVEKEFIIVHPRLKAGFGSCLNQSRRGRLKTKGTGFWQWKAIWRASGAAIKEISRGKLSNQRVFSGMSIKWRCSGGVTTWGSLQTHSATIKKTWVIWKGVGTGTGEEGGESFKLFFKKKKASKISGA